MAECDIRDERLHVGESIATGGGIANVSHCILSWELREIKATEDVRDETEALVNVKVRVSAAVFVDRDDSGPLLPAMLLRVQT
jgi:hypothetical protein